MDPALDGELAFISLPGILATWFSTEADMGVKASLIDSYPILLSMLFAISRNQLAVSNAECAFALTSHPLMVT